LLYINDLPNCTSFFTSLFADDTGFLKSSSNLGSLFSTANQELAKAADWFQANKLTLNVSKTKFIIFRNKSMPFDDQSYSLKIGDEIIDRIGVNCREKYFKFVGIRLDEFLKWDYQLDHICNKISSATFALNSIKNVLPLSIRKLVYNSLIKSHLEYGILAWGSSANKKLGKLCTLQKKAIRILANSGYNVHTDPLFSNLGILKIKDILTLNASTFMYKYFNSKLPLSFIDMFIPLAEPNRTKSFKLEFIRNKHLETFPKVFIPRIWNSIPLDIKHSSSLSSFKCALRRTIFDVYSQFNCSSPNCYSCSFN